MVQIFEYKPQDQPLKVLIYGKSGTGKTHLGSTAPSPIFASAEEGLLGTSRESKISYATITSVKDLQDLFDFLKKGEHSFKTVVLDSISEINEIIKDKLEKDNNRPIQRADWMKVQKDIKAVFKSFKGLDMNVIIIAQEKIVSDGEEGTISQILPSLNGKSSTDIAYSMDVVGYCYIDPDGNYQVTTKPHEKLISKCRGNFLEDVKSTDFKDWIKARNSIKSGKEKEVANHEVKVEPKKLEKKKELPQPPLPKKEDEFAPAAKKEEPKKVAKPKKKEEPKVEAEVLQEEVQDDITTDPGEQKATADQFENWDEEEEVAPVTEPDPEPEEEEADEPEVMMATATDASRMFSLWDEFYSLLMIKDPSKEKSSKDPIRKATIKGAYGVDSSKDMSHEQVMDFCKKLEGKISTLTEQVSSK